MDHAAHLALLDSPILQRYLSVFSGATEISLRYLPGGMARADLSHALRETLFTRIIMRTLDGEAACLNPILTLITLLRRNQEPAKASTVCGLIYFGMPLVAGGSTVGMLLAGPMITKIPDESDHKKITRQITAWGSTVPVQAVGAAYCAVPVIPAKRLKSAIALLSLLTNELAIHHWLLAEREREPRCVTAAKGFIQQHATDQLTIEGIARHVSLSADHLGKIFKQSTHMTMGQYISQTRVEHVKRLLPTESCRVIEAAFTSGFQSVAQFNRVFKKYVGVNPSQYRASLRRRASLGCRRMRIKTR
jgi:AraC-like DNA-binding protein/ligand-binding sensor protein